MREDKNFLALLKLAHIVKYSHDRIDQLDLPNDSSALLEIQTLGRGGARFRTELGSSGDGWHHVEAKPVARMVDSAGCGDWFTAGLISSLCSEGMSSLKRAGDSDILGALDLAQSLAAWNCSFAGPRGGMYTPALKNINAIFNARQSNLHLRSKLSPPDLDLGIYKVCGDCREKPKRMSLRPERRSVGT
jgi:fructokinase